MARVKTTAIISDIRGKLNGSVFQGNNGILSIRQNASKVNNFIVNRQTQRNRIVYLQGEWQKLTNSERGEWNNYAQVLKRRTSYDSNIFINGQSTFIYINSNRLYLGETIFTTPQGYSISQYNGEFTVRKDSGRLILYAGQWLSDSGFVFNVKMSRVVNASVNYSINDVKSVNVPWIQDVEIDITDEYLRLFGSVPNVGDSLFLHYAIIDAVSGLQGLWIKKKVIVQAVPNVYDDISSSLLGLWSLRKRISSYEGACCRIKLNQSPFTTENIHFKTDGTPDWDVWQLKLNKNNWFVDKIYSQINNNDIVIGSFASLGVYDNGFLNCKPGGNWNFNPVEITTANKFAILYNGKVNVPDGTFLNTDSNDFNNYMNFDSSIGLDVYSMTIQFTLSNFGNYDNKFSILNCDVNRVVTWYNETGSKQQASTPGGSFDIGIFGDGESFNNTSDLSFGEFMIVNRDLTSNEITQLTAKAML